MATVPWLGLRWMGGRQHRHAEPMLGQPGLQPPRSPSPLCTCGPGSPAR